MDVKELKDTIALKLSEVLPAELKADIDNLHALLAEAATPAPVENQVKTKDGKILSIAGDLNVGIAVSEVTPDGLVPLVDGEYTLESGEVIEVVGGLITEVAPGGETETPETPMQPEMQAQMDAQKNEIADLKTKLESVTKQNLDLAAALKKILETPIEVKQAKQEKPVDVNSMSPLEYRRYMKSLNK